MSHTIAGIDVHKKLLVVVIVDAAEPDVPLRSRRFGAGSAELRHHLAWLGEYGVAEAVMESTAQYWKPVWMELEPHMRLHLAQAQSNKAPKGRKSDLADTKRLLRRFAAGELMLSFIPEPEQRVWRMVTRGRLQLVRERVQLQNQIGVCWKKVGSSCLRSLPIRSASAGGGSCVPWLPVKPARRHWQHWATSI